MAAKDKACGNNLVALKDLDLGAWIDRPGHIDCEDQRWIGAPDPTDNLKHWSGGDPCADMNESRTPFAWSNAHYVVVVWLQSSFLVLIITCLPSRRRRHPPVTRAAEIEIDISRPPSLAASVVATPAGVKRVILLQDRIEKRLLCGMLTLWKRLVDESLWAPGGKRFREHSLTCAAAAAMQA
eukprot:scaffold52458_cov69-Phaeocystis_antarctica.AAC.8